MTTTSDYQSIVTISLMASFSDGVKNDRERENLAKVVNGLGVEAVNLSSVYHDVLLKRVTLEQACAGLTTPETRQLAYEMAVAMCDADGSTVESERTFLNDLAARLGLPAASAATTIAQADAFAATSPVPVAASAPALENSADQAAIDPMIVRYAILAGALELLPQSLASLAILPLQVKMVYRIGRHAGLSLDAGHIKEFIATMGIGMTGQMLDGMARKFLGGLARKMAGGMAGSLARGATSAAVSFATTWAIGQVARQYYASGRRLETSHVRSLFSSLKSEGEKVYARYAGDIQQKAGQIDIKQLISGKLDAP